MIAAAIWSIVTPFIASVGHSTKGAIIPGRTATGVNLSIRSIRDGMRRVPINPRKENRIVNVPMAISPIISQISDWV